LFYLSLTGIDVCLDTVQIAIASLKVKEKARGLPHMIGISFKDVEKHKLVQARNRCRNV
jgi:hypothetical protein